MRPLDRGRDVDLESQREKELRLEAIEAEAAARVRRWRAEGCPQATAGGRLYTGDGQWRSIPTSRLDTSDPVRGFTEAATAAARRANDAVLSSLIETMEAALAKQADP